MAIEYPDEVKAFVREQRAQGHMPRDIALSVRERFPKFPHFSARAAAQVGTDKQPNHTRTSAERRTAPRVRGTTCQYITIASWPGKCGAEGYPYCEHHKHVVAQSGSSWPQFKSYGAGIR